MIILMASSSLLLKSQSSPYCFFHTRKYFSADTTEIRQSPLRFYNVILLNSTNLRNAICCILIK